MVKQAIFPDFPYGGASHVDTYAIGLGPHKAIVASCDAPARRDTASITILKSLNDVELEIMNFRLEVDYPLLERISRADILAAGCQYEILMHEAIDRVWVLGLPPDFSPEIFNNFDAALFHYPASSFTSVGKAPGRKIEVSMPPLAQLVCVDAGGQVHCRLCRLNGRRYGGVPAAELRLGTHTSDACRCRRRCGSAAPD
jgi:hypothetical protein